jgi:hypothetical protein
MMYRMQRQSRKQSAIPTSIRRKRHSSIRSRKLALPGHAAIFSIKPISSLDIRRSMSTRISMRWSKVPKPIK